MVKVMGDGAVALAAIGLVTAILAVVVKPLFSLLRENTKAQAAQTKALESLVAETRKGNVEAAQRNGHLGEQNEHITSLIINHAKEVQALVDTVASRVIEGISDMKVQNIDTVNVKEAHIEKSEINK